MKKLKNPAFYLFQKKYPKRKNFNEGFLKLCKELKINADIRSFCTRRAYDNSDYTGWSLLFRTKQGTSPQKELERVKELLNNIEYKDQKVFNVSGNGWGTGLSVMLNINKL